MSDAIVAMDNCCGCECVCQGAMAESTHAFPGWAPFPNPSIGTHVYHPGDGTGDGSAYQYMQYFWGDVDATGDLPDGCGNHDMLTWPGPGDRDLQTRYLRLDILVESFLIYGGSSPSLRTHALTATVDRTGLLSTLALSKSDDTSNAGTGAESFASATNFNGTTSSSGSGTVIADSALALFGPATVNSNPNGGSVTLTIGMASGVYYAVVTDPWGLGVDGYCRVTVTLSNAYALTDCYNDAWAMISGYVFTPTDFSGNKHHAFEWAYNPANTSLLFQDTVTADATTNSTVFKELATDMSGVHLSKVALQETLDACLVHHAEHAPVADSATPPALSNAVDPHYIDGVQTCFAHWVPCSSSCNIDLAPADVLYQWGNIKVWGRNCLDSAGEDACCDVTHIPATC